MPPLPFRFLARNRLIAALADAVVVVQAPARSGALSTARFARELGRPLFAVPAAPWDPRSEGVLALLVEVARVCRGSSDLRAALGLTTQITMFEDVLPRAKLGADAERVLGALSSRPIHVDAIVRSTELPAPRVQVALLELSIAGYARHESGTWRAMRAR
jgi:DNA processing protein